MLLSMHFFQHTWIFSVRFRSNPIGKSKKVYGFKTMTENRDTEEAETVKKSLSHTRGHVLQCRFKTTLTSYN